MTVLAQILSFISEAAATPVGILMATNTAIAGALTLVYRDCRKDRAALWKHVRELEEKITK